MGRFFIGILGLALFLISLSSEARGQRIYIGPGGLSIGAGNVQVDLFGGDHHAYGPSYYHHSDWHDSWYGDQHWSRWGSAFEDDFAGDFHDHFRELPPPPSRDELAFMNWKHLRRVLRFAAANFDDQLDSLRTGPRWRKHLQVGAIRDQVAEDINSPPDRKARRRLREVVAAYHETAENPQYDAITRLWGFRVVHAALDEFVSAPWMRERRQLAASARELERELDGMGAGRRWQKHLALPEEVFASMVGPRSSQSDAPDPGQLRGVLARFDAVSRNRKYRSIAGLKSFQATHEILGNYVGHFVKAPPPPPLP